MKYKIINNKFIFVLIFSIISFIIGANATGSYNSNEIKYAPSDTSWSATNVNDALNSLYPIKKELTTLKGIGNASADTILSGYNAVVKGNAINGSMKNNGSLNTTLAPGGSYNLPSGYISGGTISARNINVSNGGVSYFWDELSNGSNESIGINYKSIGVTSGKWIIIMVNLKYKTYDSDDVTMWIESGMNVYSSGTCGYYNKWNGNFGQSYMFFGYTTSSNIVIRSSKNYRWGGTLAYINIY